MVVKHPLITWAQRSPHVYISVEVDNMDVQELTVTEESFKIKGTRGEDIYEADLQLYGKLKGDERRQIATDRRVELVIPKVEAEWWPRLLKEKTKVPWIKVDFDKWKDEDEETAGNDDLGFGGGGFGGGFGGDNIDFSQFGMPGGGAGKFDGLDDDDDEDDEEMGELEDIPKEGDAAALPASVAATNNNASASSETTANKSGAEASPST